MISFYTNYPHSLLKSFRDAIDEGHIKTWSKSGNDFTHNVPQWQYEAWMRPYVHSDRLDFGIIGRNDRALTKVVYGIYHGRLSEAFLNHFDDQFTVSAATSALRQGTDLWVPALQAAA